MPIAITRKVSPAIARCELTHLARSPIDVGLAGSQHEAYERTLSKLGCWVVSLPAAPDLPDSVFVEDTAVVVDEVAVITRPGSRSRRPETASVAAVLAKYRPIVAIEAPGTIDGGDVLRLGRRLFVGLTERTNREGINQLRALLSPHGYVVEPVPVSGCLHLKSAVTQVAPDTVLVNAAWVDAAAFAGFTRIGSRRAIRRQRAHGRRYGALPRGLSLHRGAARSGRRPHRDGGRLGARQGGRRRYLL
jgi:dimethylargininase